ncbi:hypothetical protein BGAPBR_Q0069 (plasmid) [Borreliella garinii PBr]|uniref:Uncharacterized protein n=1 Tax=Borreliella garinii PBr TaxID=498743 RepID=B8F1E6_BORGR|nr:hypothetical protein BGAPBR_Q0069 [Borreliella garinii PBr]
MIFLQKRQFFLFKSFDIMLHLLKKYNFLSKSIFICFALTNIINIDQRLIGTKKLIAFVHNLLTCYFIQSNNLIIFVTLG